MLPESGMWVGPPVLLLVIRGKTTMLDGVKRSNEHSKRGLKTTIPYQNVTSYLEAIKALIHNGHPDRAAEIAIRESTHLVKMSGRDLERLLDVSHSRLTAFRNALLSPAKRHKLPRRAMTVVKRVRLLHAEMLEGKKLEIGDLEEALGEFLQ